MNMSVPINVPVMGEGIRLFPGDRLKIERKHGSRTEDLENILQGGDIIITITGNSYIEGSVDPYVRMHFHCPKGVYVSTHRAKDGEIPPDAPDHKCLTITRRIGESFIIRAASIESAVDDLCGIGVMIDGMCRDASNQCHMRIAATTSWSIYRSEIDPLKRQMPKKEPIGTTFKKQGFDAAFIRAAEELLSDGQLEQLRARAIEIMSRR